VTLLEMHPFGVRAERDCHVTIWSCLASSVCRQVSGLFISKGRYGVWIDGFQRPAHKGNLRTTSNRNNYLGWFSSSSNILLRRKYPVVLIRT
jgi:hypothetical protein